MYPAFSDKCHIVQRFSNILCRMETNYKPLVVQESICFFIYWDTLNKVIMLKRCPAMVLSTHCRIKQEHLKTQYTV